MLEGLVQRASVEWSSLSNLRGLQQESVREEDKHRQLHWQDDFGTSKGTLTCALLSSYIHSFQTYSVRSDHSLEQMLLHFISYAWPTISTSYDPFMPPSGALRVGYGHTPL
jgi:hypothetical protein